VPVCRHGVTVPRSAARPSAGDGADRGVIEAKLTVRPEVDVADSVTFVKGYSGGNVVKVMVGGWDAHRFPRRAAGRGVGGVAGLRGVDVAGAAMRTRRVAGERADRGRDELRVTGSRSWRSAQANCDKAYWVPVIGVKVMLW